MAAVQTMLSSLAQNAASALGGHQEDEKPLKKGPRSGPSVAWFFVAACGASLILRVIDSTVFFDDGEALMNVIQAFLAFAGGMVISKFSGFAMGQPVQGTGIKTPAETNGKPKTTSISAAKIPFAQTALSEEDSALVSDIVDAGHKGSFAAAEKLLEALVQSLGSAGDLLDELPKGSRASTQRPAAAVHSMVEVCIRAGDAQRAATWLEKLHRCGLRCVPRTLRLVLEELSNGASTAEAEQFFSRMLTAGAQMDSLCYQLLFERLADTDASIEAYLRRLEQQGASERVAGYVALIRSCALAGDTARAEHWMERCLATNPRKGDAAVPAGSARSADPSWSTATVEHWLRQMLQAGAQPDAVDYYSVIGAWDRQSDGDGARRLLNIMRT